MRVSSEVDDEPGARGGWRGPIPAPIPGGSLALHDQSTPNFPWPATPQVNAGRPRRCVVLCGTETFFLGA
jgi:hypothetical protein